MTSTRTFQFGDRVVHHARPEWGIGVVTNAQKILADGSAAQRLTVRFEREGMKTVSTAHADIRPAGEAEPVAAEAAQIPEWLGRQDPIEIARRMGHLPEPARDPFATPAQRLKATLNLYRFSDQGSSLLDWAAMQTGLTDPLSRFSRHELEEYFRRFAHEREQHLRSLLSDLQKSDPAALARIAADATPDQRSVLQRLNARR